MKKLTAKEEEIMNIFWQHGPMFIREMLAFYKEPKPHYNTVATLVKLLVEKGFVTFRVWGNSYRYDAIVSEKEYKGAALSEQKLKKDRNKRNRYDCFYYLYIEKHPLSVCVLFVVPTAVQGNHSFSV